MQLNRPNRYKWNNVAVCSLRNQYVTQVFPSSIQNIELPQLEKMIQSSASQNADEYLPNGRDFIVVDVRDDDFLGGNISTARHIPSEK